jgi:hypothetical protein
MKTLDDGSVIFTKDEWDIFVRTKDESGHRIKILESAAVLAYQYMFESVTLSESQKNHITHEFMSAVQPFILKLRECLKTGAFGRSPLSPIFLETWVPIGYMDEQEIKMEVTLDEILGKAVQILQEQEIDPAVIWTAVVSVIAARDGITIDEASENLANLLNSVTAQEELELEG